MQIMAQTSILPFRKANTILISTNLTGVDAYFKWHGHLIQNGFSIDECDSSEVYIHNPGKSERPD